MAYTPDQTQEIIARILELRSYWRRVVESRVKGDSRNDEARLEAGRQGRE